jgi:hypothetical protein
MVMKDDLQDNKKVMLNQKEVLLLASPVRIQASVTWWLSQSTVFTWNEADSSLPSL